MSKIWVVADLTGGLERGKKRDDEQLSEGRGDDSREGLGSEFARELLVSRKMSYAVLDFFFVGERRYITAN